MGVAKKKIEKTEVKCGSKSKKQNQAEKHRTEKRDQSQRQRMRKELGSKIGLGTGQEVIRDSNEIRSGS